MAAVSTYNQGQVAKQTGRNNAIMAEYAAQDALRRGEQEAQAVQRKAAQLKGSQRALMAAKGLDLSSGTPADLIDSTDFFAENDANTARFNARKDAWSARAGGANAMAQGKAAASQATLAAAGTLLSTGGSVADKWYQYGGSANSFTGTNDFKGVNGGNAMGTWLKYGKGGD